MNSTLRTLAFTGAAAAATAYAYARLIEPRWVHRTRTTLHFRSLPPPLEGLRIALLTDMHAKPDTPSSLAARVVRVTNAERPDLIAITGDIAETEPALEAMLDVLSHLRAPLGVYVVPGNHDYRDVGIQRWHDAVARRRTLVDLTNRCIVQRLGQTGGDEARLCIAGVDDLSEGRPSLAALPPPESRDFTVLLAHQPDQAERARRDEDDVDLILSGHTHGGQVRLPFVGAVVNSSDNPDLYDAGVRRRPWTQVYTSRGLGTTHLPVRFLAPPEVAILTLTSGARPPRAGGARR